MGRNVSPGIKALILLLFLAFIFSVSLLDGGTDNMGLDLTNPATIIMLKITQAVSAFLIFIVPSVVFVLFTSEKKLGYLKLNSFTAVQGFGAIMLVFTAMPVINWLGEVNNNMRLPEFLSGVEQWMRAKEDMLKEITEMFLKMNSVGDLIANLFIIALLAAVGEELLFRGALQNVLVEWIKNKHVAVWITAILFSALHAQFYGFFPRMLLGVVLGYLYIWSGSLWLSILFHFLNNGLAVLASYLIGQGAIAEEAETVGAGNTPFVFVLGGLIASLGLLFFLYKNRKIETEAPLPPEEGLV